MSDTKQEGAAWEGNPALSPEPAEVWEAQGFDVLDGFVDIPTGRVDVVLGGPGGARDESREARLLAGLLLKRGGLDGGPLLVHSDLEALRVLIDRSDSGWHRKAVGLDALDKLAALLPPMEKR